MTIYATIDDAQNELSTTTTNATENARLYDYLRTTSRRVDHFVGSTFEPDRETKYLGIYDGRINSSLRTFALDDWAFVLNSVSIYGTSVTVGSGVIGWPSGMIPFAHLQLVSTSDNWYSTYANSTGDPIVEVNADWGYHTRYTDAWQIEDSVQDAGGINATVTTVTVTDADGTNWRGATPRFSAGQMIRINEEWLRVVNANTTANTLTVQRGINGSTAAAHALSDDIYVWYPVDDVRQGVARQAALMYKRRGAFESTNQFGVGTGFVADLTADLLGILQEYRNI
jgi:hypothetical protein